jgi:predicted glycosyltransferase
VVVTIRPPATAAHYRNSKSDKLFQAVIKFLASKENCKIIMLARTEEQDKAIRRMWRQYFRNGKIKIPNGVVNGLNLIWHSDLVISGGGTIIREAAALRVPAYSIFGGKIGAVDQHLADTGRLTLLRNDEDIHTKIVIDRRSQKTKSTDTMCVSLQNIVDEVVSLLDST